MTIKDQLNCIIALHNVTLNVVEEKNNSKRPVFFSIFIHVT